MVYEITIKILNNEVKLDTECFWCSEGARPIDGDKCDFCNGTGYMLTSAGRAIIDLAERHIK